MSAAMVSLFFAAGASVWLYNKFMKYTGNNTKSSVIAAGFSAIVIFLVFFMLFNMLPKNG